MPSKRVSLDLNDQTYFLTFTVKRWYYLFDRHERWDILSDSLNFCIKNKSLKVYAYVFMLNHIHLLVSSPDVSGFIRDFKKYTAFRLMKNLKYTEPKVAALFYSTLEVEDEKFFKQLLLVCHKRSKHLSKITLLDYIDWRFTIKSF